MRVKIFFIFAAVALLAGVSGCGAISQIGHGASTVGNAISWCVDHWATLVAIVVLGFIVITLGPTFVRRLPWWFAVVVGAGILLWLAGQSEAVGKVFSGMARDFLFLAIVGYGLWLMVDRPGRRHR